MKRIASVFCAAALLNGCSGAAVRDGGLAGSRWTIVSVDGDLPVSTAAKLAFNGESIDATVGCNRMDGPWRIERDRLIAGPISQTEMYCDGPLWDQEEALGALLVAAPEITVTADRMTLRSSGHSAELRRAD